MEERRQFVRLDTRVDVTYSVLPSGTPQRTVAKNISGGGICVFLEQPVPQGTRLQAAVKLPEREHPVDFTAEVIRCETYEITGKAERQRVVEADARFLEISPTDQEAVMQYVVLRMQPGRHGG